MKIEPNFDKNVYVISLQGKLISQPEVEDLYSHFRRLRDQKIVNVILDLELLDWMGSVGLGALISCVTTIRKSGGDVRLTNLNYKLKNLLSITKLDRVFQIFESVELAAQSFHTITH